jgi:hypothetical protein
VDASKRGRKKGRSGAWCSVPEILVNAEAAEARGRRGATSANIGHILARSNDDGRDAAAAERNEISDSGH